MLTRTVRLQVLAFVVIALAAVAFVGANYAGLDRLFGGGTYVVRLQLDDGGGLFTNSEVTYRGVAVGRVGELRLTDDGMEADLVLDDSAPRIPVDTKAVVANRSAIGEQYVDLQPRGDGGPFLDDGAVIRKESTTVPMPVTTLLGEPQRLQPVRADRVAAGGRRRAVHGHERHRPEPAAAARLHDVVHRRRPRTTCRRPRC